VADFCKPFMALFVVSSWYKTYMILFSQCANLLICKVRLQKDHLQISFFFLETSFANFLPESISNRLSSIEAHCIRLASPIVSKASSTLNIEDQTVFYALQQRLLNGPLTISHISSLYSLIELFIFFIHFCSFKNWYNICNTVIHIVIY
jgi:hypothetical protein